MDLMGWIALVAGAVTAVGGFIGGRRMATASALEVATGTVSLMESQIALLQSREADKEDVIRRLTSRIEILEGMVLQREDLSDLKRDVRVIKEKLHA